MLVTVDGQTATRLLRIYGINPAITGERFLAHHEVEGGIPVTIHGIADAEFGPSIRLKISGKRSLRMCPPIRNSPRTHAVYMLRARQLKRRGGRAMRAPAMR
jgi:hypothetical protein